MNDFLRTITSGVEIGETIMHWHKGECLLSIVTGFGISNKKHAFIVEIDSVEVFVTEIV